MAKSKHGLPETKGQFKLRGLVTGTKRDNFFKSITTKSKKKMNILNFGVETAPESTVYVTVQGMERDETYFSKRSEEKGKASEVKTVPWNKRFEDQGEGFQLIGINVGLQQDEQGKNIVDTYTDFDAAEEIKSQINDGDSVFIIGDMEYSSFKNNKEEVKRSKKFQAKRLYSSKSIDFEAEDFTETSDFKQRIIFVGIDKADDKDDPHFELEAKIVTYDSVEDTDFVIRNVGLANTFRTKLKPYTAIDIWGQIFNKVDSDDVEEANVWGASDSFKRVNKNYIRELVITGADPESIDTETYTEDKIAEALKPINEFGSTNDWGNNDSKDISDDDLPW